MPSCHNCPGTDHWSHMDCSNRGPHGPHSWTSEIVIYGPYHCSGKGEEARDQSGVTVVLTYPPGYCANAKTLMNEVLDMVLAGTPVTWEVEGMPNS